jgi:hypothetical protein
MRKNKKALTFIAVFLGVLVLYCLMNHSEGFDSPFIFGTSNAQGDINRKMAAIRAAAEAKRSDAEKAQIAQQAAMRNAADANIPGLDMIQRGRVTQL